MYGRAAPKPRTAQTRSWPAPTAGWISNRALAQPNVGGPGASVLDNFFPRAGVVKLRRGKERYATLVDTSLPVTALFSYKNGLNQRLFAANANTIYDITDVPSAYDGEIVTEASELIVTENGDWFGFGSTEGLEVFTGTTGGDWSVVQFATTGGVYLIGVNGQDTGFIYDGQDFWPNVDGGVTRLTLTEVTGTFADGETVTGATSAATGTVLLTDGDELFLTDITGTFANPETVTGAGGATGTISADPYLAAPGVTFAGDIEPHTTADMSFVFTYQSRLYFIQKDSLNFWYMNDPDAIGGEASLFPLAGVLSLGGSLVFGQGWSLPESDQGGVSTQCVFVSDEGEVAAYQGNDPSEAASWTLVGIYRIGAPFGKHAWFRGAGDLAIATSVGLVPLSKAFTLDITALSVATVSYNITDAWADARIQRGSTDWVCQLWPEQKTALVAPPNMIGADNPVVFIANVETGAWARYTGWNILCMEVFQGQLYFGSPAGQVYAGNVSGLDDGAPYTGTCIALYDDMGAGGSLKVGQTARPVSYANAVVNQQAGIKYDYDYTIPAAPDAATFVSADAWGTAIWGQAVWGQMTPNIVNEQWQSGAGVGYVMAPFYQVTSGSLAPVDDQMVRWDVSYSVAAWVS